MTIGMQVRIIWQPYFGSVGLITDLPIKLQRMESESMVRVVEVELEDGRKVIVPRANVEIVEK